MLTEVAVCQDRDMSDRINISITDGVADVKLTRADKRNALDAAMFLGIEAAGERLKTEPGVRAVVLSGDGPSFCAGLDMSSMQSIGDSGDGKAKAQDGNPGQMPDGRITHLAQQVCWVWQELPMPVIAAVHGHALGGGMQLALGADIRIAHPDTKMSIREVYWGLVPDMTGTFMLSKLVRPDIARELTYTARIFSGTEAADLGLVTRLSETPYEDAMALAREIAVLSPGAVRGSKEVFNALDHQGAAEAFANERRVIGAQIGTANQKESVIASFEKRPPVFADV